MGDVETFLREAWAATEQEKAQRELEEARQELEKAAAAEEVRRTRRRAAYKKRAASYASNGAFIGSVVSGFAGCVSCTTSYSFETWNSVADLFTEFTLLSGLLYGGMVGAAIGAFLATSDDQTVG